MSERQVIIDDDHNLVIKKNRDYEIKIDLCNVFANLTDEERERLAESITWDAILKEASHRLLGDSTCWGGDDQELRLEFLSKVEDRLLSGYQWHILGEFDKCLSHLVSEKHIYWMMYHDEQYGRFFRKWMEQHGIESQHNCKLPEYEYLKELINGWFEKLLNQKGVKVA